MALSPERGEKKAEKEVDHPHREDGGETITSRSSLNWGVLCVCVSFVTLSDPIIHSRRVAQHSSITQAVLFEYSSCEIEGRTSFSCLYKLLLTDVIF